MRWWPFRKREPRYWVCIVRDCEKPSEPRMEIGKTAPGAPFCDDHGWGDVPS